MDLTRLFLLAITGLFLGIGCRPPAQPAMQAADPNEPTQAQPRLTTLKLWLGPEEMQAEIARAMTEIRTGMMFRQQMAENEGMLFVFPQPHRAAFWMRNTLLPLSCAFIDSEGVILEIRDMKARDETSIEAATNTVRYVLETRQGWFERHKINVGVVIRTEKGSLEETFFRR